MSDAAPSFTVEVMGFPEGSDPEVVAESLAGFFGISLEEGRRLVRKAPVRVKRSAPPDVAQQLVRQLRKLGADVRVRNEQTGEERTFAAGDGPISRIVPISDFDPVPAEAVLVRDAPPDDAPPEDTLESEDANAPMEQLPRIDVVIPSARARDARFEPRSAPPPDRPSPAPPLEAPSSTRTLTSQAPILPPISQSSRLRAAALAGDVRAPLSSRPEGSVSSQPGEGRASDQGARASDQGARASDQGARPHSLPPPSSPMPSVPPPSRASLHYCSSCKAPMEKGDVCARCGWNSAEKRRHCRQCKKELGLVSSVSKSPALLAAIVTGSIAMGAGALLILGLLPALGALAFGAVLGFLGDGLTLRYACKTCAVAVYSERLLKEEEARLAAARRRSLSMAAAGGVLAAALVALPAGSSKTMSASSFGVAWSVAVPGSHGRLGSEVVTIQVPAGAKRARIQYAEKTFLAGRTYLLINIQYSYPAGPAEPDKAGLQACLQQVAQVVFNGSVSAGVVPAGESFEAEVTGTFQGKPVAVRLRGTQYDHDMVVVGVTSPDASDLRGSDVDAFLSSVTVQRDAK